MTDNNMSKYIGELKKVIKILQKRQPFGTTNSQSRVGFFPKRLIFLRKT